MKVLILCATLVLGGLLAHLWDASDLADARSDLLSLKAKHSEELADVRGQGIKRLKEAQARADKLQIALDRSETRIATIKKDTQREIVRTTSGRACLGSSTVGLLNNATTASTGSTTVPTAASGPAEEDAAIATDTDVATWANDAIEQYNVCRARLGALIDWHQEKASDEN